MVSRHGLIGSMLFYLAGCSAGSATDAAGGSGGNTAKGSPSASNATSTAHFMSGATSGSAGTATGVDPTTCEEAAQFKTYIGCDFYPTVLANMVWSLFDFAVVVANTQDQPATVHVTGNGVDETVTVPANGTATVYLPWVPELKGPDPTPCSEVRNPMSATVRGKAYHLVSSLPVTVYQFSPLEFAPVGGPPGKDWSSCPADNCMEPGFTVTCHSYSNDASLLLPSTAMTGNYRVTGYPGWLSAGLGASLSVTGLENGTEVTVTLSATAELVGGGGVPPAGPGETVSFEIGQGEVVQLIGGSSADFSGSLVQADRPMQVIHGLGCTNIPSHIGTCDHIEESVLPAETLGRHYVVPNPTGPEGSGVQHFVRFYGNVDGTSLSYAGSVPPGAPLTLNAGEVVELQEVTSGFEVTGTHEFGVGTFLVGLDLLDAPGQMGDPSQSVATAVEQFRRKYVFLAPVDYDAAFVDVVMPPGTSLVLDGAPVAAVGEPISPGFVLARLPLSDATGGSHVLTSDVPFGIQVMGYGFATSFMYPGGLNLDLIAPPPPPPK